MITVSTQEPAATTNPNEAASTNGNANVTSPVWLMEQIHVQATIRSAKRKQSENVRTNVSFNATKVLNAVRAIIKSELGGVTRVPDDVDKMLNGLLSTYVEKHLKTINPLNFTGIRSVLKPNFKSDKDCYMLHHTAHGKDFVDMKEQAAAVNRDIADAERLEKRLMSGEETNSSNKSGVTRLERTVAHLAKLRRLKIQIQVNIEDLVRLEKKEAAD